jgi:hypothetical protein
MTHILYAYIAKPTSAQVGSFDRVLQEHGVSISHLGKNDPPPRFGGSVDEAVGMVFSGTDLTDHTFGRDAARKLHFDIQIHHDPRGHIRPCLYRVPIQPRLVLSRSARPQLLTRSSRSEASQMEASSRFGKYFTSQRGAQTICVPDLSPSSHVLQ